MSPGKDGTSSGDDDLDEHAARDQPGRVRAPLSPSSSLSTTVSELEVEHGEAFLRVKRLKREEDLSDSLPDPEVISSDEDEEPIPKKRKKGSTGVKSKGKKATGTSTQVRSLMINQHLAEKAATKMAQQKRGGKGKKRAKSGT